eukprot:scaffold5375_cov110-Isochrysis_galbana.AAC.10
MEHSSEMLDHDHHPEKRIRLRFSKRAFIVASNAGRTDEHYKLQSNRHLECPALPISTYRLSTATT